MKKNILLITVALLTLSFTFNDQLPKGWFKAGSHPNSYVMGLENKTTHNGAQAAFIESSDKKIKGFGTLMQTCSAKKFIGKRVKMTGYIKAENVKNWTGMWLRIDGTDKTQTLGFDNMQDRKITGTCDWKICEIILDVPKHSDTFNFGVLLSGTGKVWFDNIVFEEVKNEEPTGNTQQLEEPTNIDFEE